MIEDPTGVLFAMGVLVLGTIITVTILLVVGSYLKARAARREQDELERLVAHYDEHSTRSQKRQDSIDESLATLNKRLAEIERMLRTVE